MIDFLAAGIEEHDDAAVGFLHHSAVRLITHVPTLCWKLQAPDNASENRLRYSHRKCFTVGGDRAGFTGNTTCGK